MFLDGKTIRFIAETLTGEGIPTPAGKQKWSVSTLQSILSNEKYKGDALLQKTIVVDYLTKKVKKNEGDARQYYISNSHECCPYVNTFEPPQKARKMGVSWDMCVAHPSSQMAKRLHIGEL